MSRFVPPCRLEPLDAFWDFSLLVLHSSSPRATVTSLRTLLGNLEGNERLQGKNLRTASPEPSLANVLLEQNGSCIWPRLFCATLSKLTWLPRCCESTWFCLASHAHVLMQVAWTALEHCISCTCLGSVAQNS